MVQPSRRRFPAALASALPPSRPEALDSIGGSISKPSGELAFGQFALSRAPIAQRVYQRK